jgi:hypothetical protein
MTVVIAMVVAVAGFVEVLPLPLELPPFPEYQTTGPSAGVSLELLESRPNMVTDYESWFEGKKDWQSRTFHSGGANNAIRGTEPPPGVAGVLLTPGEGEFHLSQVIRSRDGIIALYGSPPNRFNVVLDDRIIVIAEPLSGRPPIVLDFLSYAGEGAGSTFQQIRWAELYDGVLYVSNAHRTYASNSSGLNGYLTAIDLEKLQILWRSGPLTANAANFIVRDDIIISAYGFTDEDDFIYLLNRWTGEVAGRIPVPTAPEYLYLRGNLLHVRCYGTDLVFRIRE